tara:strand:+ start:122 stop:469 length:348 start_codon:yes stop_codon:yes gene_type:complete
MSNYQIYHNPKCSKSRETLELLKAQGVEPEVIEYLERPLTELEILELLKKLDSEPQSLVRTKEDTFKKNSFDIETSEAIAKLIAQYPELMERPVVVKGHRAVLGRPPQNVGCLLQ